MKRICTLAVVTVLGALLVACGGAEDLDKIAVSIDTMDLPYAWQSVTVPGTPYDESQPPGPMGLPDHIQILFGVTDPADVQFGDPILYIIPAEDYAQLWEEGGNSMVRDRLDQLEVLLEERPDLATASIPALPPESSRVTGPGAGDISVQKEYLDLDWGSAVRYVSRNMQDANPITNERLFYRVHGLSDDGEYLVSFYYPVTTDTLPDSIEDVPQEEAEQVMNYVDLDTYFAEKNAMLDSLSTSNWEPDLATLDEVIGSLQFGGYGK
jgi:hypothetical protein